jgi:hypothetical protein
MRIQVCVVVMWIFKQTGEMNWRIWWVSSSLAYALPFALSWNSWSGSYLMKFCICTAWRHSHGVFEPTGSVWYGNLSLFSTRNTLVRCNLQNDNCLKCKLVLVYGWGHKIITCYGAFTVGVEGDLEIAFPSAFCMKLLFSKVNLHLSGYRKAKTFRRWNTLHTN